VQLHGVKTPPEKRTVGRVARGIRAFLSDTECGNILGVSEIVGSTRRKDGHGPQDDDSPEVAAAESQVEAAISAKVVRSRATRLVGQRYFLNQWALCVAPYRVGQGLTAARSFSGISTLNPYKQAMFCTHTRSKSRLCDTELALFQDRHFTNSERG
jgi:hypothetical protein